VAGVDVGFTASAGAKVKDASVTTGADGLAKTTVTSTTAGAVTVTAKAGESEQSVDVNFTANMATAVATVTPDTTTADADGKSRITLSVVAKDDKGNLVPNLYLNTNASGSAKLAGGGPNILLVTNENGEASVIVTDDVIEPVTVTVKNELNSSDKGTEVHLNFEQNYGIKDGDIRVTQNNAYADGESTNAVEVKVTDVHNEPVSGAKVEFSANNGASVTAATVTTDANGRAETTVTSTTAGQATVTATTTNGSTESINISFQMAERVDYAVMTGPTTILADGKDTTSSQVRVINPDGSPAEGVKIFWNIGVYNDVTKGYATLLTPATVYTNANGVADVTFSSTIPGKGQVDIYVNGVFQNAHSNNPHFTVKEVPN
ncbi:Ig-like domain-containing protein, partial [Klebsiella aerogenes]